MQNSALNRLLFAIVTRPFIRRYEIRCANARDGYESLSPVRTIYISLFCFVIDRRNAADETMKSIASMRQDEAVKVRPESPLALYRTFRVTLNG